MKSLSIDDKWLYAKQNEVLDFIMPCTHFSQNNHHYDNECCYTWFCILGTERTFIQFYITTHKTIWLHWRYHFKWGNSVALFQTWMNRCRKFACLVLSLNAVLIKDTRSNLFSCSVAIFNTLGIRIKQVWNFNERLLSNAAPLACVQTYPPH